MSRILLIRHAHTDMIGVALSGRMPGVCLSNRGREQAERLAADFVQVPLDVICSSPLERTLETAQAISGTTGAPVEIRDGLIEIDYGEWTGWKLTDLMTDEQWRMFRSFHGGMRIPGGEHIDEVRVRMVGEVEELQRRFPTGVVALVSHADPIRAVLAHYAGIPPELSHRVTISLASVSVLAMNDGPPRILCINRTEDLRHYLEA
ncbi:histidine phosphatase family protein [Syntrophobacter fumaroxidans]|uniref:Phosphoglycerate mutase n=1 Tax=Syntrophobacter fumaroxidans (strain DSM 10017 / MPOB) TaxID=335543 RepID=A0LET7_SYNFM|nr:histidine phosphatase family protein [Syntrophobacter fumaroxidans]ABK15939.1 Phosphoglycerate mutase [Syntrophobacter fumaroxidans MPOB]